MIFALLGGDARCLYLAELLRADGHTVRPFALETALPNASDDPADAARGADCVLLPLPAETGGALTAPLSAGTYRCAELLARAAAGTPVCAGMASPALRALCAAQALPLHDYFLREDFTLRNAELTAEGALPLLLDAPWALRGSHVLLVGYGRIARCLAAKLTALGAQVTAAARSSAQRAQAELDGCRALPLAQALAAGDYAAVVNTVPAPILGAAELRALRGALCIELASAPGGFDAAAAQTLQLPILRAGGLPGKTAPRAAAEAMRRAIYAELEEGDDSHG